MNTIAERIKFAMGVRKMRQVELVQKTGISKGAFSSYLSGSYNPKQDKLELIADALDVNIDWLLGKNVPMQIPTKGVVTGQVSPLPYVFYKEAEYLVNDVDDTYTAYMPQYSALIPRFHVIVNTSCNEMHMLPLFYRDDSPEYYDCPADLITPERHQIYTKDFDSIGMYLETSRIIYYGIDKENCKPEITTLAYSPEKGCYERRSEALGLTKDAFQKEIEKEALFLEKNHP